MLTIDDLRLVLPAGFEARAPVIARLVGDALAARPLSAEPGTFLHVDHLAVPRVEIHAGASDADVAGRIADAIHTGLCGLSGRS